MNRPLIELVDSGVALPATLAGVGPQVVPLVRPSDGAVLEARTQILSTFAGAEPHVLDARGVPGRHLIWVLDPDLQELATWYAARTGRDILMAPSAEDFPDVVSDSMAVVALAGTLTQTVLERLQSALYQAAWGVITGRDLAAVSFVMAKSLLYHPHSRGSAHYLNPRPPACSASTPQEHDLFGTHDRLVIEAHGESGHVSLGTTVLCALPDAAESYAGRPVEGGCTLTSCKRARGHSATRLVSVTTRLLAVLTCNSFVAKPTLCPTNISIVTAASEGHIVQLLGTDRPVAVPQGRGLDIAEHDHSLSWWARRLNEHHHTLSGERPYFLAGDPLISIISESLGAEQSTAAADISTDATAAVAPPVLEHRVSRAWDMVQLSRSIDDLDDSSHAPLGRGQAVLREVAERYPAFLRRGARALQTAGLNGTTEQVLTRVSEVADRYELAWQHAIADVMNAALLQRYLETYVSDGFQLASCNLVGHCSSCSGVIRAETWSSPGVSDRYVQRCAVCGVREIHSAKKALLTARVSGTLVRGGNIRVHLSEVPQGVSLVTHFRDNGDGRWCKINASTATGEDVELHVPVPLDATPEVHTVRVAALQHASFSIWRWRLSPDFADDSWFEERAS